MLGRGNGRGKGPKVRIPWGVLATAQMCGPDVSAWVWKTSLEQLPGPNGQGSWLLGRHQGLAEVGVYEAKTGVGCRGTPRARAWGPVCR